MPRRAPTLVAPLLAFGALTAALALEAPPAGATTTISRAGRVLTLTGDDRSDGVGARAVRTPDQVTFYALTDTTDLRAGPGCRFLPGHDRDGHRELSCGAIARPGNPLTLRASLGAGDDRLSLGWNSDRHPRAIVDAGPGDDVVGGTSLADELSGGAGRDQLTGYEDRDTIKGGPGDDTLSGGADSDAVFGEEGRDRLFGDQALDEDAENNPDHGNAGMDVVDSTDYPTDPSGYTAEQIAAITPEPDQVFCGWGELDGAVVDGADTARPSCELVSGGGRTATQDTSPRFPASVALTPRPRYDLDDSLTGQPIRFTVNASAGGFVTAKLELFRADARRFHVRSGRVIAATASVAVTPQLTTELFMRLNWQCRVALGRQRSIPARLTVRVTSANAAGAVETTARRVDVVLR